MPDPTSFALFCAAALVLAVTPGPGLFHGTARSLAGGRAEGVASSLGTGRGGMVHVLAGAPGVSAVVLASAELFTALKLIGAAYLSRLALAGQRFVRLGSCFVVDSWRRTGNRFGEICLVWIGYRTLRTARSDGAAASSGDALSVGAARAFREGVLVEALNPKTAAFFLAFVPHFVDPAARRVALHFVMLGAVSVALATLADLAVAVAASRLRSRAAARPGLVRRLRAASGAAMIALGAGLALARRPAT